MHHTGHRRAGSQGLSSPRGTPSYVDLNWTEQVLKDVIGQLNPILLEAMEKQSPEYAAMFRDVVIPANQANLLPNLAILLRTVINQSCDWAVTLERQATEKSRSSLPSDRRFTIDLNVIAHQGGQVQKIAEYDDKGRITKMITEPI